MCKLQDLRSHNVPGGLLPDGVWLVTHGYEWLRGVLGTSNDAQPPPSPSLSVPHPRDKRAPPCLAWVGGGGAEGDRVRLGAACSCEHVRTEFKLQNEGQMSLVQSAAVSGR